MSTSNLIDRKMPTESIAGEEVGKLRGIIREYRPGHFQVSFYYQGERFFLYRYLDGSALVYEVYAKRLLEHINSLIDSHKFDPSEWRKDTPYLFEKAVDVWIELSTCSEERLITRRRVANLHLIPFFQGRDVRDIRRIDLDRFQANLKSQKYSEKTIYNIMGELKAFFNSIRDSIPKIPTFPKIGFQETPIRWLSGEDQDHVFEFIPEPHIPIFTFMRWTGCRPNEARGLLRENVFLKHEPAYLVLATVLTETNRLKMNTKTRIAKPLPIIPEIEEASKPKPSGKVVSLARKEREFVFTHNGEAYRKRKLE